LNYGDKYDDEESYIDKIKEKGILTYKNGDLYDGD